VTITEIASYDNNCKIKTITAIFNFFATNLAFKKTTNYVTVHIATVCKQKNSLFIIQLRSI